MVGWYLHFTKERFLFGFFDEEKRGMYLLEERSVGLCRREFTSLRGYQFKNSRWQQTPEGDTCPAKTTIDN